MTERKIVTEKQVLDSAIRELKSMRKERDLREYNVMTRCANVADSYNWEGGSRDVHDSTFLQLFARRIGREIADRIREGEPHNE